MFSNLFSLHLRLVIVNMRNAALYTHLWARVFINIGKPSLKSLQFANYTANDLWWGLYQEPWISNLPSRLCTPMLPEDEDKHRHAKDCLQHKFQSWDIACSSLYLFRGTCLVYIMRRSMRLSNLTHRSSAILPLAVWSIIANIRDKSTDTYCWREMLTSYSYVNRV